MDFIDEILVLLMDRATPKKGWKTSLFDISALLTPYNFTTVRRIIVLWPLHRSLK